MSRATFARARLSVAPRFQEFARPPGNPLYREGRVPGPRVPETQSWLAPGGPCAPPAAGSQRAAPRAGEAAAALLPAPPYLLYFGLQVHVCVSEGFLLLSGIQHPGPPGLRHRCGYWGRAAGSPAPLPQPLARRRQTSAAQSSTDGLRRGQGTKRPRQPMAAGPRRAAANHRAPHAPSRPERGEGKVRGGTPSGAAPCGVQFGIPDLVSEAALAFSRPAGKELEPSLPPTKEEPFHSVSLYLFLLGTLDMCPAEYYTTTSFLVSFPSKEIVEVVRDPCDGCCTLISLLSCGDGLFLNAFLQVPSTGWGSPLTALMSMKMVMCFLSTW